ncbi:MAG: hypothetical protein QXN16_03825 [Candidatus Micrarchaeaceae archaeon]
MAKEDMTKKLIGHFLMAIVIVAFLYVILAIIEFFIVEFSIKFAMLTMILLFALSVSFITVVLLSKSAVLNKKIMRKIMQYYLIIIDILAFLYAMWAIAIIINVW